MKKSRRKLLSCKRRDLWDSPRIYDFYELSVDRLKFKLAHLPKKDIRLRKELKRALHFRKNKMIMTIYKFMCGTLIYFFEDERNHFVISQEKLLKEQKLNDRWVFKDIYITYREWLKENVRK